MSDPLLPPPPEGIPPWQQAPWQQAPRRFSTGAVIGGIACYLPVTVVLSGAVTAGGLLSNTETNVGGIGVALLLLSWVIPIGIGITMITIGKTPHVRGFGLGMAVGWAAWLIIGAGVCFGALAVMGSGSFG